jgi:hypothetical protein
MKVSKEKIRQIIQEEIVNVVNEHVPVDERIIEEPQENIKEDEEITNEQ